MLFRSRSAVRVRLVRSPAQVVGEVDPLGGHETGGPLLLLLLLLNDLLQFTLWDICIESREFA